MNMMEAPNFKQIYIKIHIAVSWVMDRGDSLRGRKGKVQEKVVNEAEKSFGACDSEGVHVCTSPPSNCLNVSKALRA